MLNSPKHLLWFILGLVFVGYCLFQARYLMLGPSVTIVSPKDGEIVLESAVEITGKARNVAWISLNDHQIYTDEEGYWSEKLILSQGLSIMTAKARDRFGRETQTSVRIILK
jgi:hypothetical protein